jgi:hypothetical protein
MYVTMENSSQTKNTLRKRVSSNTLVGVEEAVVRDLSWKKNYERKVAIRDCIDNMIWVCWLAMCGISMIGIYVALYV